jgi:signal transduction histidine kinase
VTARRADDRLRLTIVDDGHGGVDAGTGSGLLGICRRAGGHDGTLTLTSPPGGLTTVE